MTDHVHGEDSYVECDYYHVLHEDRLEEIYPDGWDGETDCYCGADSVFLARVGFTTRLDDPEEESWPRSVTQDVKVHRCEEHRFDPDEENQ